MQVKLNNFKLSKKASQRLKTKVERLAHYEAMIDSYSAFLKAESSPITLGDYDIITFKRELLNLAIDKTKLLHMNLMNEIVSEIDDLYG